MSPDELPIVENGIRGEAQQRASPTRKIISISRRTDIAAFYSRWLLRRLEAGFCEWLHPFGGKLQQISLRPEDCLALVFWTRNPTPLLPSLGELTAAGYRYFFHYTLTGYPKELETHNPSLASSFRQFRELAEHVGPDAIIWRYDPLVISSITPTEFHLKRFETIARELRGATHKVYFSFVNLYGKTRRNFEQLTRDHQIHFIDPEPEERRDLVLRMKDAAEKQDMALYACCEDALVGEGVKKGRCVDMEVMRTLCPNAAEALPRRPTRKQCGCTESVDIGTYDTCPFGCRYCYATQNRDLALRRLREHDSEDSLLWRPESLREPTP